MGFGLERIALAPLSATRLQPDRDGCRPCARRSGCWEPSPLDLDAQCLRAASLTAWTARGRNPTATSTSRIELLHSAGADPLAALPVHVRRWTSKAINGRFSSFLPPTSDALYGVTVFELNVWRSSLRMSAEQLVLGRPAIVEVDAFTCPTRLDTSYRSRACQDVDRRSRLWTFDERRLGYFHNAGYYELKDEDFAGVFRLEGHLTDPEYLPPYVEVEAKLGQSTAADRSRAPRGFASPFSGLIFARRPFTQSVLQLRRAFSQRPGVAGRRAPRVLPYDYAFATLASVRRCVRARRGIPPLARSRWGIRTRARGRACAWHCNRRQDLQFKTARAVNCHKPLTPSPMLDDMASSVGRDDDDAHGSLRILRRYDWPQRHWVAEGATRLACNAGREIRTARPLMALGRSAAHTASRAQVPADLETLGAGMDSRAADRCRWQQRFARPDCWDSRSASRLRCRRLVVSLPFSASDRTCHTPGFASTASQQSSMCGSTERTSCVPTACSSRNVADVAAAFSATTTSCVLRFHALGRRWLLRRPRPKWRTGLVASQQLRWHPHGASGTHARLVPSCRASGPVARNSAPSPRMLSKSKRR